MAPPEDEAPFQILGQVTGPEGPATDAQIQVYRLLRGTSLDPLMEVVHELEHYHPLDTVTSGANGIFEAPVREAGSYLVSISLESMATATRVVRLLRSAPEAMIQVTLTAGAGFQGRLADSNGGARPGEAVHLLQKLPGRLGAYHAWRSHSDSDGSFAFDDLEPGRYVLHAAARGSSGALMSVLVPSRGIVLQLPGSHVLTGRVSDSLTDEPVGGVRIRLLTPTSFGAALSDSEGQFVVHGSPGAGHLVAQHPEHLPYQGRVEVPDDPNGPEFTVKLIHGAPFAGRLLDQNGNPAARVDVGFVSAAGPVEEIPIVQTGDDGRFSLPSELIDEKGLILPRIAGAQVDHALAQAPFSSARRRELRLRPTRSIVGWVVTLRGQRVAGATVRLVPTGADLDRRAVAWLRGDLITTSGEDGSFSFDDVIKIESYRLEASHDSKGIARQDCDLAFDHPFALTLKAASWIDGHISDHEVSAGFLAHVVLERPGAEPVRRDHDTGLLTGGERQAVRSGARFRFDDVPVGPVRLHVESPGFVDRIIELELFAGQNKVQVELKPGTTLRVVLAEDDVAGVALVNLRGTAESGRTVVRRSSLDGKGRCSFLGIPNGTFSIYAGRLRERVIVNDHSPGEIELKLSTPE